MTHHHHHPQLGEKQLGLAFTLNLGFTLIEIIGGLWTNSVAILSDAVHDLGDSLSLGLAWYLQRLSGRSEDEYYSFGYRRFTLLGALINSLILVFGSLLIWREALPRLWHPDPAHAPGMMGLAPLGIVANGLAVWRLQGGKSFNQRTVRLHLLEAAGGWPAVLIGGGVMYLTDWAWIDPLLSLGLSTWVLIHAVRNLRGVLRILLQAVPDGRNPEQLRGQILALEGVEDLHDFHIWTLDGEFEVASLHLRYADAYQAKAVQGLKQRLRQLFTEADIEHLTVKVEAPDEDCSLLPEQQTAS